MPVIVRQISIAANSVNANLFAGSAFEWMRQNAVLSVGACQSATGLFMTLNVGSDVVAEEFEPIIIATDYPIIPDHFYFQDAAALGDRLVLATRNSTGGALIARAIAIITGV